ncbi:MAG: hypothetical protein R3A79_21675 [Nannocystaceae bacterium]
MVFSRRVHRRSPPKSALDRHLDALKGGAELDWEALAAELRAAYGVAAIHPRAASFIRGWIDTARLGGALRLDGPILGMERRAGVGAMFLGGVEMGEAEGDRPFPGLRFMTTASGEYGYQMLASGRVWVAHHDDWAELFAADTDIAALHAAASDRLGALVYSATDLFRLQVELYEVGFREPRPFVWEAMSMKERAVFLHAWRVAAAKAAGADDLEASERAARWLAQARADRIVVFEADRGLEIAQSQLRG